jgi:hypothetical protein
MWQHAAWGRARFVEGRAIRRKALLKLRFGKVEDEEHLLLVCPNTQKVQEHFCSTLPLTHTSTFVELMQTTNMVVVAKFVACCQFRRQYVLHDLPFI